MLLHLSCKGYGIGLDLPATPDVVVDRLSKLREGHRFSPLGASGFVIVSCSEGFFVNFAVSSVSFCKENV